MWTISSPASRVVLVSRPSLFRLVAMLLVIAGAAACMTTPESVAQSPTLFDRMGGARVVDRVVDAMVDDVLADPALNRAFAKANPQRLKERLSLWLCSCTGGGCAWTDDSIRQIHAGMKISEAEMYGVVEALVRSLEANGVARRERNELLAVLAPLKRDIVTR